MPQRASWFGRVEAIRESRGLSVDASAKALGISRATYYIYSKSAEKHPRDWETIERFAEFLSEDPHALAAEMAPEKLPTHRMFLEAASSHQVSTQLYQQHILALAHALGMTTGDQERTHGAAGSETRTDDRVRISAPHGVDVAVRLLREHLAGAPNPVDALVGVLPRNRGGEGVAFSSSSLQAYQEPYQYQIYVAPLELLNRRELPPWAAEILARTRAKVDSIIGGAMLPVTREHSTELAVELLRDRADLVLYPGLLDLRPPQLGVEYPARAGDIVVTGIYYAGAPDVAALLARARGYGFSTFDGIAKQQVRAGLRGLPSAVQQRATRRIIRSVLVEQSPSVGPMVWATDDPDALLALSEEEVHDFEGTFVLLQLSDEVLDYAAHRVCRVDEACPSETTQCDVRDRLRDQQNRLRDLLPAGTITHQIELPSAAARKGDLYPDAVDAMFDEYVAAAQAVDGELGNE